MRDNIRDIVVPSVSFFHNHESLTNTEVQKFMVWQQLKRKVGEFPNQ